MSEKTSSADWITLAEKEKSISTIRRVAKGAAQSAAPPELIQGTLPPQTTKNECKIWINTCVFLGFYGNDASFWQVHERF